jgi:hypothetical protein
MAIRLSDEDCREQTIGSSVLKIALLDLDIHIELRSNLIEASRTL